MDKDTKIEGKLKRLLKRTNTTLDKYTGDVIFNCEATRRKEELRSKLLMKIMKKKNNSI